MSRLSGNKNLKLYNASSYKGLPVITHRGPLLENYLESIWLVMFEALDDNRRVFAFRVDIRFPDGSTLADEYGNRVIERFFASLKAKINHSRKKAQEINPYAHTTRVRNAWAREIGDHGVPHYHLVILLNNDAFCTLGLYDLGRKNLFNRVNEALASALKLPLEAVIGLVEFPDSPYYVLRLTDPDSIQNFFYRASYLCKADTKHYGNGVHSFGCSRK